MPHTLLRLAWLATLAAGPLAPAAAAQVTSASVVGTVTDSSGAALPGASVTARNADTGFTRTVTANETGAYRLDVLPIGRYSVEAALSGFTSALRSGIVLAVNDAVRIDLTLPVGAMSDTVTV